jgi:hypothetical protein
MTPLLGVLLLLATTADAFNTPSGAAQARASQVRVRAAQVHKNARTSLHMATLNELAADQIAPQLEEKLLRSQGITLPGGFGTVNMPTGFGLNQEQLDLLGKVGDKTLVSGIKNAFTELFSGLAAVVSSLGLPDLSAAGADFGDKLQVYLGPAVSRAELTLQGLGLTAEQSQGATMALAAIGTAALATAALGAVKRAVSGAPLPLPTTFDLPAIEAYYQARPTTLYRRLASISYQIASFSLSLWIDSLTGKWEKNMPLRAAQVQNSVSQINTH